MVICTFLPLIEKQGSLYRILPAGEGILPQDTVTPPVTDESESGAEDQDAEDDANGNGDNNNNEDENSNENE